MIFLVVLYGDVWSVIGEFVPSWITSRHFLVLGVCDWLVPL